MNLITLADPPLPRAQQIEIVERKGAGHPDTLADGVAEAVSRAYSRYCLDEFGAILHHNTDKTALLGGSAIVSFGHGELTEPILVLVNGRLTERLGNRRIPVDDIVTAAVRDHLRRALPLLDPERHLRIRTRVGHAPSPGMVTGPTDDQAAGRRFWFEPRDLDDLAERHRLFSNDTSAGIGYAPLSPAERVATLIENHLNSEPFTVANPGLGSDIKIMVVRDRDRYAITACVPQIAEHTPDLSTYVDRRRHVAELIGHIAREATNDADARVDVNTRDDDARRELYLTAIGSSIESGDEGVVGRGNRANGLISMFRPMSMEGVSGKNPVYHVGKLYNLVAQRAAELLWACTERPTVVALVSQSGRDLDDPWQVIVRQSGHGPVDHRLARQVVGDVLESLDDIRAELLSGKLPTA